MRSTSTPFALALTLAIIPSGCGTPGDEDLADARNVDGAVTGMTQGGEVSAWFSDTGGLTAAAAVTVEQARPLVLANVGTQITAAVSNAACVEVTSDQATFVMATFTDCAAVAGRRGLSGTVKGVLGFATTPCGPANCPTALVWTLDADLTWGDGSALLGAWEVRAPLDPAAARTLTGATTATGRDREAEGTVDAAWSTDAIGCVTASGAFTLAGGATGTIAVTGLVACPGACPSAGSIVLSGARRSLAFTYDGSATVQVTAGTRQFALPLLCGG